MKWVSLTLNIGVIRKSVQNAGSLVKIFVVSMMTTLAIFLLIGIGGIMQSHATNSPVNTVKGLMASVSNQFIVDILGMEVPHLQQESMRFTFSQKNIFQFMFRFLTSVDPTDKKSLMTKELPGMSIGNTTMLRPGIVTNPSEPEHLTPPGSVFTQEPTQVQPTTAPIPTPAPSAKPAPVPITGGNVAFIYQTHSSESFLPEIKDKGITDPDQAHDPDKNITMVGDRLSKGLEKAGIGTVHSSEYYPKSVKNFNYNFSYKYSLNTLKEAFAANPKLNFYFDIHRDSLPRNKTTVTIDGKDYAQLYFIVGGDNAKWKQNEGFANQIHQLINSQMPGISKGVYAKSGKHVDGLYNQNFSPNLAVIEIGGPENTLEECYRTADLLAKAISQVILKAEKVDAQAASPTPSGDKK
ncbi:stage II sporulation protein P [Paenibacillus sp. N1-5-1-14]|uniref:stage II sporulation protein P n=1 Tax=Paenibacillus radicibacter TaxID=2972488 RepID=UPI0021598611|nr:stage II sporulation protein P [Paenibacillus radicibacter]MCR8645718.1 stage II sporulation protein P [Paenibacillus radicibacter]